MNSLISCVYTYLRFVTRMLCSQPDCMIRDSVLLCNLGKYGTVQIPSVSEVMFFLSSRGNELKLPWAALADKAPSLPDAVCWQIVFATRCVISVFYLWIHLIKIHSCRCKSIYHLSMLWQGQREDFYFCSFFALYFGLFSPYLSFPAYSWITCLTKVASKYRCFQWRYNRWTIE